MNTILYVLHKRIFNLEIALQANSQILNRSHSMINNDLLQESLSTLSQRSIRNSFSSDLEKVNVSFDQTTINPSNISLREGWKVTFKALDNFQKRRGPNLADTA